MSPYDLLAPTAARFPVERLPGRLALAGVESEQLVRYRVRATGEERWALVRGTAVYDDGGRGRVRDQHLPGRHRHAARRGAPARRARARVRRRRRLPARRRGRDPVLEPGGRGDHRACGSREVVGRPADGGDPGLGGDRRAAWRRGADGRPETVPLDLDGREVWLSIGAVELRRRHGLRVPRPDRGARARAAEGRLRLDGLTRAADAAGRDLRRFADAAARRHRAWARTSARLCSR